MKKYNFLSIALLAQAILSVGIAGTHRFNAITIPDEHKVWSVLPDSQVGEFRIQLKTNDGNQTAVLTAITLDGVNIAEWLSGWERKMAKEAKILSQEYITIDEEDAKLYHVVTLAEPNQEKLIIVFFYGTEFYEIVFQSKIKKAKDDLVIKSLYHSIRLKK